jgi:hypothetical protein
MTLRSQFNRDWNRLLGHTRGKCSYGDNHESVSLIGDCWLGESTNLFGCVMAPRDPCSICQGLGTVPLDPAELEAEQANAASVVRDKPCGPCNGSGRVPGPHWPWGHDHPGPLPTELL